MEDRPCLHERIGTTSNVVFICKKIFKIGPGKDVRGVVGRDFLAIGEPVEVESDALDGPDIKLLVHQGILKKALQTKKL